MPLNAMANLAFSAATRKSHANASEAPAPAATPLTAAPPAAPAHTGPLAGSRRTGRP